jgi:redox-sensitive bicupin YhaK (pirin superfamily)
MWPVQNPFLFFAHHLDKYPAGNENLGPAASLSGRVIGNDFEIKDGWRMYHGSKVPGFPVHPHRGFETITIVLQGYVDHSDSHGQQGRYSSGDVQWMTAGAGLQHCEMFPLLNSDKGNTTELFQIWLNLPKAKKFAEPYFKMLWNEDIPVLTKTDEYGKSSKIKIITGNFEKYQSLTPAPDSWAANTENEVAIWNIEMEANAVLNLPSAKGNVSRTLYYYIGDEISLNDVKVKSEQAIILDGNKNLQITNGNEPSKLILLQGKPIDEPVEQYGPFVMNSRKEIMDAFNDYQKTQFGGWQWQTNEPVFPRTQGRFAKHRDGTIEER